MKRSKEKKEELKRDLGGSELVDLSWDVYYKKVNSSIHGWQGPIFILG